MRFDLSIRHEDADLVDYQRAALARQPGGDVGSHLLNAGLALVASLCGLVAFSEWRGERLDIGLAFTVASLTLACFYLIALVRSSLANRAALRGYAPDRRDFTVVIDEDGVAQRWRSGETRENWSGIESVEVTARLVILWMDEVNGFALPKRAIGDLEAQRDFLALIRARITKIGGGA